MVIGWLSGQTSVLEKQIAAALDRYSNAQPIGRWARSIVGVGPIITSGLIAHIDIKKAETASDIWSFAGLNPTVTWAKGQKRPWNAALKTLCWKLGQSFMKVHNNPRSFYGKMYEDRKASELAKNEAGERAAVAAEILTKKNFGKSTDAYKAYSSGKLPPAHIDARARRYAVKMFLAHFHEEWRTLEGLPLREAYAIQWLGHAHHITPKDVSEHEATHGNDNEAEMTAKRTEKRKKLVKLLDGQTKPEVSS